MKESIETTIGRHEERISHVEECTAAIKKKLDKFYLLLIGVLGGMVASLVLLVVNLSLKR